MESKQSKGYISKQNNLEPRIRNQNLVDECERPAEGIKNMIVEMGVNSERKPSTKAEESNHCMLTVGAKYDMEN